MDRRLGPPFFSIDAVDAWVKENNLRPQDVMSRLLRGKSVSSQRLDPGSQQFMQAWLDHQVNVRASEKEEEAMAVAWTSAGASVRQADAAERAVLVSAIALGLSVVAFAVSVLAYIKPPEQQVQSAQAAPTPAAQKAGTSLPTTPAAASRP